MKKIAILVFTFVASSAFCADKIKFYFNNEEITKIIEIYSKASGQKFIIDPGVRGKISIFNQQEVDIPEAFNQLSTSLAINGFAIGKEGDTMVIRAARNMQRSLSEVSTEVPSLKPERMATWVVNLKHISAVQLNRDFRIMPSKDGEITVNAAMNQLIISDFTSNLNRIADILKQIDRPVDPAVAKLVEASRREPPRHEKDHSRKDKSKNTDELVKPQE